MSFDFLKWCSYNFFNGFLLDMHISNWSMYLYARNHLRLLTTLGLCSRNLHQGPYDLPPNPNQQCLNLILTHNKPTRAHIQATRSLPSMQYAVAVRKMHDNNSKLRLGVRCPTPTTISNNNIPTPWAHYPTPTTDKGDCCGKEIMEWGANQKPTTFKELSGARA